LNEQHAHLRRGCAAGRFWSCRSRGWSLLPEFGRSTFIEHTGRFFFHQNFRQHPINMYKIVFVVAVFAFALQGAYSSPVAAEAGPDAKPDAKAAPAALPGNEETTVATTPATGTTTPKASSGASTSQMCMLLVQISSLALITKHVIL